MTSRRVFFRLRSHCVICCVHLCIILSHWLPRFFRVVSPEVEGDDAARCSAPVRLRARKHLRCQYSRLRSLSVPCVTHKTGRHQKRFSENYRLGIGQPEDSFQYFVFCCIIKMVCILKVALFEAKFNRPGKYVVVPVTRDEQGFSWAHCCVDRMHPFVLLRWPRVPTHRLTRDHRSITLFVHFSQMNKTYL